MKSLKMIFIVMLASLFSSVLSAQVSINVNLSTPSPRYYYLQELEVYYDIQTSVYIYPFGGRWIRSSTLPASYGHYDMRNLHRITINDYRGNRPYYYYNEHRVKFPKGSYGNPGNSYWSAKEHQKQVKKNNGSGKEYKNNNGQKNKDNRNDKGNGNRGNGRGNKK